MSFSEKTIYFLSENNFKVSGIQVEGIVQQLDPEISLVIGGVDTYPEVKDGLTQFSSFLDFGISSLRNVRNVLKNDRTLLRSLDSLAIASSLSLSAKHKELYGDSDDLNVSDVLEVLNLISLKSKRSSGFEISSEEANKVLEQESGSNLINSWSLLSHLRSNESEFSSILSDQKNVLLIFEPEWFSDNGKVPDLDFYKIIFGEKNFVKKQVVIETPLDKSLCDDNSPSDISFSLAELKDVSELSVCEASNVQFKSRSAQHCLLIVDSYLRLLVNSRDELSLANVVCGPTGIVDEKDFTFIKNEAKKTKMPLFQTLISFANKAKIGGQCLANLRDHPFAPFQKELVDFANLMDKLQVKIEDARCPEVALSGVAGVLRSHLSSKMKLSIVAEVTDSLPTLLERLTKRRDDNLSKSKSPKRDISSGGSMVGMRNILSFRQIVDFWSAAPLRNKAPNLHVLLGKIEDSGLSPALLPNVLSLFKSPTAPSLEIIETESKRETEKVPEKNLKSGRPKFEASLAWAAESSPIIYESPVPTVSVPDTDPTTPRLKLLTQSTTEEKSYLQKGREDAEQALREAKLEKKKIKQLPKRSILSEINNLHKFPKKNIDIFRDEPPAKKMKEMPELSQEKVSKPLQVKKVEKPKKVSGKKQIAQIKGQSKITAFMRV